MHPALCKVIGFLGLDEGKKQASIVTKIIFPTIDMAASADFYGDLGFDVTMYDEGYAWINIDGRELFHLARYVDLNRGENRAAGYFHVRDVDEVHQRWTTIVPVTDALGDRPWGMREFSITDPSGNLLRVGQNL